MAEMTIEVVKLGAEATYTWNCGIEELYPRLRLMKVVPILHTCTCIDLISALLKDRT